MAEILTPSAQWQVRLAKELTEATPMVSRMWGSLGLEVQSFRQEGGFEMIKKECSESVDSMEKEMRED